MALQVELNDNPMAFSFPEAYVRISSGFSLKDFTTISIRVYATAHARTLEANPVMTKDFKVSTASLAGDLWPAMYSYLKSLPEFTGAIDV